MAAVSTESKYDRSARIGGLRRHDAEGARTALVAVYGLRAGAQLASGDGGWP